MNDNMDEPTYYDNDDDPPYPPEYFNRLNKIMNKDKKYEANKYYVGSNSVFNGRNWGHPTENLAIKHAQKLMEDNDQDEIFIVKIVKVIRRKVAPVEIITIK